MHRRALLTGSVSAATYGVLPRCTCFADPVQTVGCNLVGRDVDRVLTASREFSTSANMDASRRSSGDSTFDRALAHTLANISMDFHVLPGFAFYDEGSDGAANAYATNAQNLGRADGSVFLGLHLLHQVRGWFDHFEDAVACICAHEFGHIVQYKHDLISFVNRGHPTVKRSELQADYMAGYYAGLRKRQSPNFDAALFAFNQHRFGDTQYGQPDHHGTAEERGDAVVEGFKASFDRELSLAEALGESTRYVVAIKGLQSPE